MTKNGILDIFTAFIIKFIHETVQAAVHSPAFLARQTQASVSVEVG